MTADTFDHARLTRVVSGEGSLRRIGSFARAYGNEATGSPARALLVAGSAAARASGALGEVERSLLASGVEFELLEGVPPNPGVAIVDAGAGLAVTHQASVVVGVGGGSALDAAKAMAVAAAMRSHFRRFLSGIGGANDVVSAALPVIAVPTMPGSGSELNGTSVIVDEATGRKLSSHSPLAAPRLCLCDVRYMATAPRRLLAAGIADALCHAVEAAFSIRATVASDAYAEAAVRMLLRHGLAAVDNPEGDAPIDDLTRCWWATTLAGEALSLAGSIVAHPLAHPLSARIGMHHGESVALIEPSVVGFLDGRIESQVAVRVSEWFGSRAAKGGTALRAIRARMGNWFGELGVEEHAAGAVAGIDLDELHMQTLVADVLASGSRGLQNTPGTTLDENDVRELYGRVLGRN